MIPCLLPSCCGMSLRAEHGGWVVGWPHSGLHIIVAQSDGRRIYSQHTSLYNTHTHFFTFYATLAWLLELGLLGNLNPVQNFIDSKLWFLFFSDTLSLETLISPLSSSVTFSSPLRLLEDLLWIVQISNSFLYKIVWLVTVPYSSFLPQLFSILVLLLLFFDAGSLSEDVHFLFWVPQLSSSSYLSPPGKIFFFLDRSFSNDLCLIYVNCMVTCKIFLIYQILLNSERSRKDNWGIRGENECLSLICIIIDCCSIALQKAKNRINPTLYGLWDVRVFTGGGISRTLCRMSL